MAYQYKNKRFDTVALNSIPILDVAKMLGMNVNNSKKTLCFLHSEKTPSLSFNTKANTWKCFGCGEGGNVISLVEKWYGIDFVDSCKWLSNSFGGANDSSAKIPNRRNSTMESLIHRSKTVLETAHYDMYEDIIGFLEISENDLDYLTKTRALNYGVVLDNCVKSLQDTESFYSFLCSRYSEEQLLKSGFLWMNEQGTIKRTWWCAGIIFPYYAINGRVAVLQLRTGNPKYPYLFLKEVETCLYNEQILNVLPTGEKVYMCEGAMDALSLQTLGLNAVGVPGVGSFKDTWIHHIGKYNVVILFDNDSSGEKRAVSLQEQLRSKGINAEIGHVDKQYNDVNEMLAKTKEL